MAPILYSLLAVGSLFSLAYGAPAPAEYHPTRRHHTAHPQPSSPSHQVLTTQQLQADQPTLSGLAANTNVTLVYSTLGIGVQNYTCNGTAFVQTIPGSGAEALLYDTTAFLKKHPSLIGNLSQICNFERCVVPKAINKLLGNHYFDAEDRPTFNLSHAKPPRVLSAKKTGDVKAPDSSVDVDWLFLLDANDGITNGLKEVYRIDTFGGVLTSGTACSTEGQTVSEQYTAQYWFYD